MADRTLAKGARRTATGWSRTVNLINPLRAVWWLFTNVRFAIVLLALLSVVSLLGVVVPQVPSAMRGNAAAESAWLAEKEGDYGVLTKPMDAIGLFDVFHQRWFELLLAVTVASTGAYIVSRFPGIWQTVTRPRKRVPDRYFELAPHRVRSDTAVDAARLAEVLRRHRYRVEVKREGDTAYIFADRFQWAQLGTLLTHAAVIVFILAAVVSRIDAFSSPLFLGEDNMLPVFPVKDPEQMQVLLENAHAEFAADGQPLDYRADLVIFKRGDEVLRCSSTVNTPCQYGGYRFYQVAYFGYGAELVVRDTTTGNTVYHETLALAERSPSPHLRITDGDQVLLDETVLLTDNIETAEGEYRAGLVRLPGGRPLTLWLPADGGDLLVFEPATSTEAVRVTLAEGQTRESGGLTVTYTSTEDVPALLVDDLPLPASQGRGRTGAVVLQLSNAVYGTANTSAGSDQQAPPSGPPALTIVGIDTQPVRLEPGDSITIDDLEYAFEGTREFAGIDVRRDRSDTLVWAGALFTVVGLMITFWVPRRRLWAKITARQAGPGAQPALAIAGQAPTHANYTRELADLAREAGAKVDGTEDDD